MELCFEKIFVGFVALGGLICASWCIYHEKKSYEQEKNKMKKTIKSCLISVFLIASVQGMDDKENSFEAPHANNYAQSNEFGDLNQLLIGSQIKSVDANVRTKKISKRPLATQSHERIENDNNSDCLFLFYCCGFCCSIFAGVA